jgi:hypothetical protein
MKSSMKWLGGVFGTLLLAAMPIVTSTSYETARANGLSYAPATLTAAKAVWGGVYAFFANPWVFIPLIIIATGCLTYLGLTKFNRFNGGQKWWVGVQRLTVRRAACALADNLPEEKFEVSPRAKALAEEILSLINHGHMPLADERTEIGSIVRAATSTDMGPYGKKDRTYNALISVRTLNSFARGRGLKLPWPVSPKED